MLLCLIPQGPRIPRTTGAVGGGGGGGPALITTCHAWTDATSASQNCVGATVFVAASCKNANSNVAPSDNSSNTWTADANGPFGTAGPPVKWCQIYYVCGPTVTSSQTFTSNSGAGSALDFAAFSGTATTTCRDVSSGSTQVNVTNANPGSITPTQASGELAFTAVQMASGTDTVSISTGSFTLLDPNTGAQSNPMADGYNLNVGSGAAVNPTWHDASSASLQTPVLIVIKHP